MVAAEARAVSAQRLDLMRDARIRYRIMAYLVGTCWSCWSGRVAPEIRLGIHEVVLFQRCRTAIYTWCC